MADERRSGDACSEADCVAEDGLDIRSPLVADLAAGSEQPQV
jgi:hypothetical protein